MNETIVFVLTRRQSVGVPFRLIDERKP